jgi:hypothetical protein
LKQARDWPTHWTGTNYEYGSAGAESNLILTASDGWEGLKSWTARQQFRWNESGNEKSVQDMLAFILARAGISLEVISSSADISGFYPDFSVGSGVHGDAVVNRLMSFVLDVLFIEGNTTYLVYPQVGDASIYSYGTNHVIYEARYGKKMGSYNRVLVEGLDSATLTPVVADSFN